MTFHLKNRAFLTAVSAAFMVCILPASALAQDAVLDKAQDVAIDKASSMAKDAVKGKAKDKMGTVGAAATDKAMDMGVDMAKEKMLKDKGVESSSAADKSMAKDHRKPAKTMAAPVLTQETIGDLPNAPVAPSPARAISSEPAPAAALNCPAGTTAQPDGSCMITGDYKGAK